MKQNERRKCKWMNERVKKLKNKGEWMRQRKRDMQSKCNNRKQSWTTKNYRQVNNFQGIPFPWEDDPSLSISFFLSLSFSSFLPLLHDHKYKFCIQINLHPKVKHVERKREAHRFEWEEQRFFWWMWLDLPEGFLSFSFAWLFFSALSSPTKNIPFSFFFLSFLWPGIGSREEKTTDWTTDPSTETTPFSHHHQPDQWLLAEGVNN